MTDPSSSVPRYRFNTGYADHLLSIMEATAEVLNAYFQATESERTFSFRNSSFYNDWPFTDLLYSEWHSVEVMVYQYDKLFGYGWLMTSILTISHIFIFLGYFEFPSWLAWQPIQILQYPKSIQQNIKMWVMVGILVIQ
jgi:hypothetical protein